MVGELKSSGDDIGDPMVVVGTLLGEVFHGAEKALAGAIARGGRASPEEPPIVRNGLE